MADCAALFKQGWGLGVGKQLRASLRSLLSWSSSSRGTYWMAIARGHLQDGDWSETGEGEVWNRLSMTY